MDKWERRKYSDIRVGDICKRNPEWGPVLDKYKPEEIEINGWTEDEEFVVSEITQYEYVACDREWQIYDTFDWSLIYQTEEELEEFYKENGKHGDKRDRVHFHSQNLLWLSRESMRERQLKKVLN
jgi:hypothetical protein